MGSEIVELFWEMVAVMVVVREGVVVRVGVAYMVGELRLLETFCCDEYFCIRESCESLTVGCCLQLKHGSSWRVAGGVLR